MSGLADVAPGRLLVDIDGDGFADALDGRAWLGTADIDAAVEAGAELLGALAARALVLPLEARSWPTTRPALFFGPEPPPWREADVRSADRSSDEPAQLPPGTTLRRSSSGLLLAAQDGASLRRAARLLAAHWAGELADDGPPADQRTSAAGAGAPPANARLTLGTVLSGRGLYTGSSAWPLRFVGGFASRGKVPAALEVAARLAIEGLAPAVPLAGEPVEARMRTAIDDALGAERWEIRIVADAGRDVLEIAGGDARALAHACRVFARSFPRLPDGTSLDELEPALERYLRLDSRDGRLAAAARAVPAGAVGFELPYPGAAAPRLLGAPVRNGARAGGRQVWSHSVPWEGERLLEAAASLPLPDEAYVLEVYASETRPLRQHLAHDLTQRMVARGRPPTAVMVRHATKPALHWLLEDVAPALPAGTSTLAVSVGRQESRYGIEERWLRELYPVAELLELDRPGLAVHLTLGADSGAPRYLAVARDDAGAELARYRLAPPVVPSPRPGGAAALATTGGVRLVVDGDVREERLVPTDRDVVWSYLAGEVFPALTDDVANRPPPFLHEIAVIVHASEPDDRLPLDHETDSVLEGLHEEIYFGLLEAYGAARPGGAPRALAPARILPFCRADPGGPTRVTVVARAHGRGEVAALIATGERVTAPPLDAVARTTRLAGSGTRVESLGLELDGADARPALERLAWGAERRTATFPQAIELTFRAGGEERRVAAPSGRRDDAHRVLAAPLDAALPQRPLHPHEVVRHSRAWAAREPRLHLRLAHESVLGQPLVALETGHPAGPNVSRARRAAWKPTVLLSARQHANEATSTPAVLELLRSELARPRFSTHLNLVVHPLENPDGARLHAAFCSLAPNHMHHAARYTAFGADLQANPRLRDRLIGESAQRHDAWHRWRPLVHLNNHGYPAHEWIRPQTGYLPTGFENWSLPVGHLTILTVSSEDEAAARRLLAALRRRVAATLDDTPQIAARTRSQVARAERYRPEAVPPFGYERRLPFWETVRLPAAAPATGPSPMLVVITEVPDETVTGGLWEACVLAHQLIDEAILAAVVRAAVSRAAIAGMPEPHRSAGGSDDDLLLLATEARRALQAAARMGHNGGDAPKS